MQFKDFSLSLRQSFNKCFQLREKSLRMKRLYHIFGFLGKCDIFIKGDKLLCVSTILTNKLLCNIINPGSERRVSSKTRDMLMCLDKGFLNNIFTVPCLNPESNIIDYSIVTTSVKFREGHRTSNFSIGHQVCLCHSRVVQDCLVIFHLCPILIRMQKVLIGGLKKLSFSKIFILIQLMVRYNFFNIFYSLLLGRGHSIVYAI